MKKTIRRLIPIFLTAAMLLSCFSICFAQQSDTDLSLTGSSDSPDTEMDSIETLAVKFAGKQIGVLNGSVLDSVACNYIPDITVNYYNTISDSALALDAGKISAYVVDEPIARLLCNTYTDQYIAGILEPCPYAYVYQKGSEKSRILRTQMNEFLSKLKSDGTIDEIKALWLGTEESSQVVDYSGLTGENGTLEFVIISAVGAPFAYVKDNSYVGYDVDIAVRFCREYGYGINISDCNMSGFFASISSGMADFGASSICVTDERRESMDFSDVNYEGSIVIVTRDQSEDAESGASDSDGKSLGDIFRSVADSFEKTFIREERWKMFASGLGVTVLITLLSAVIGTVLGFGLFLLYRKEIKPVNRIIHWISEFLQMTPVIVILMIFYYLILAKAGFSGITVSVIAFSLMFACAVNSLLASAVKSVDAGQTLAVRALGYKDTKGFIRMILPQAIPIFAPGYRGELVGLIKSTSLVSYVSVQDLTMITDIIRARTYEAFFPLVVAAVIYFLMALLLTRIVSGIEIKTDPCSRKKSRILKGVKTDD